MHLKSMQLKIAWHLGLLHPGFLKMNTVGRYSYVVCYHSILIVSKCRESKILCDVTWECMDFRLYTRPPASLLGQSTTQKACRQVTSACLSTSAQLASLCCSMAVGC